jgi:hypothetical protein
MNGVQLGDVNLNNGIDGGDRDSTVYATVTQVQQAVNNGSPVTLNFVCAYSSCHNGIGGVEVKYTDDGTLLSDGFLASSVLSLQTCFYSSIE